MPVGNVAGFGRTLSGPDLDELTALGVGLVRGDVTPRDVPVTDDALEVLMAEFIGRPFRWLAVVPNMTTPDAFADEACRVVRCGRFAGLPDDRYGIQLGNELDIKTFGSVWINDPHGYGDCCLAAYKAVREDMGWEGTIVSAGVSNTNTAGRNWLKGMDWSRLQADMPAGIHRYAPQQNPAIPFSGFATRDQELDAVRAVVVGHLLAMTETGYHTAPPQKSGWVKVTTSQLTDDEAAVCLVQELDFWARQPDVVCCCLYQWQDGPSEEGGDRFGLNRHGVPPGPARRKPQFVAVQEWIAAHQTAPTSRTLSLTVHGPDPLTVTAVLRPDMGPEIQGVIDPAGSAHFAFTVPDIITGGAFRTITVPGWNTDIMRVGSSPDGTETGMPPTDTELPAAVMVPVAPVSVPLVRLKAVGQVLRRVDDVRWTAIQASDFNLFNRFLKSEDIEPVLQQRQDCGYNLLRVFTAYQVGSIGQLFPKDHPDYWTRLPVFLQRCAAHGLYVELVAFTGPYSAFFATDAEKVAHWNNLILIAQDATNVLLELVNELDQTANADIPIAALVKPPSPVLASHGSNGSQKRPIEPFWDYATFHTNGAFEEQRKIGHNAWEIWKGPTLTDETSRCNDVGMWRGASPARRAQLAFDSAAGAALLCAGSCFHSIRGKTSQLWDGEELNAATAWALGAQSVPLTCQGQMYHHLEELEGPNDLRVYQRGNQPEHIVRIRK